MNQLYTKVAIGDTQYFGKQEKALFCQMEKDNRLLLDWSMSLTMQWLTSIIIRITKVEKKGWIINMIMEKNDGLLQAVRLKLQENWVRELGMTIMEQHI